MYFPNFSTLNSLETGLTSSSWLVENTIGQTSDLALVCVKERRRTKRLEIEPIGKWVSANFEPFPFW